jgi:hypothetical protein
VKAAQENRSQDPVLKKRAGGVVQGEGLEFKPQYHKKKGERNGMELLEIGRHKTGRENQDKGWDLHTTNEGLFEK